jgi:hypothetical protein
LYQLEELVLEEAAFLVFGLVRSDLPMLTTMQIAEFHNSVRIVLLFLPIPLKRLIRREGLAES